MVTNNIDVPFSYGKGASSTSERFAMCGRGIPAICNASAREPSQRRRSLRLSDL